MMGILKRVCALLLAALQALLLLGKVVPICGGTEEQILIAGEPMRDQPEE